MEAVIAIGAIIIFFAVLLLINRKNLGVSSFNEYATANSAFGFIAITFSVLATWYVGATFTAWAASAIGQGFTALYVTPYATFTTVVMMLIGERTFVWAKRYKLQTQSDLIGYRYDSKTLQLLTGLCGVIFSAPWLLLEWVTQGYIFQYASGGRLSPAIGMLVGIIVVVLYVSLGGMKSVITANVLQGALMIFGGTALFIYLTCTQFQTFGVTGVGSGFQMLLRDFPEILTYPGPAGIEASPYPVWASMVIASAFGGFLWPWAYNKLFASSSAADIKKSALLAPALGTVFYLFFVILGNMMHFRADIVGYPDSGFMLVAAEAGPIPLALMSVLIMAVSVGTVSGIMQAMSTGISRDIAPFIKKDITDDQAIKIARIAVIVMCALAYIIAVIAKPAGQLLTIVLFTYQGIVQLFPIIILGLWWKRANAKAAIASYLCGTAVAMILYFFMPAPMAALGWSGGMYGLVVNFAILIIGSAMSKPSERAETMFKEYLIIKALTRQKVKGAGPGPVVPPPEAAQ